MFNIIEAIEHLQKLNNAPVQQLENMKNYFNRNGALRGNHIKSFKEILNSYYQDVEISGFGKRGKVTLKNLREIPLAIEDKRSSNGRKPTAEEVEFYNRVMHNTKSLMQKSPRDRHWTNNTFAYSIGIDKIENISDEYIDNIYNELVEIFGEEVRNITTKRLIKFEIVHTLREHTVGIIQSALNYLSKHKFVYLTYAPMVTNGKGSYVRLSEKQRKGFVKLEETTLKILGHEKWFLLNFRNSDKVVYRGETASTISHDFEKYKGALTSVFKGHILFQTFRPNLLNYRMDEIPELTNKMATHKQNIALFMQRTLKNRMPQRKDSMIFNKRYFHVLLYLWLKQEHSDIAQEFEEEMNELIEKAKTDWFTSFNANPHTVMKEYNSYYLEANSVCNTFYASIWEKTRDVVSEDKILTEAIENALGILDN